MSHLHLTLLSHYARAHQVHFPVSRCDTDRDSVSAVFVHQEAVDTDTSRVDTTGKLHSV